MLITDKYTLQLKEFLEIYNKYDGAQMSITYIKSDDSYQVHFVIPSVCSHFDLVTQKNTKRIFKSMKSLLKAVPIDDAELHSFYIV
jgi:hypothetical protein